MKYLLIIIAAFSLTQTSAQSKTLEAFQTKHSENGYKVFLYQSVIRMLNKDNNDDFNQLVKDLDHIKVIVTDSSEVNAKAEYNTLVKGIKSEGYEELLMMDNKDMKVSIYESSGSSSEKQFVAFMYTGDFKRTGSFEMKGELDLKHLSAFDSLDFNKLKEIAETQN